VLHGCYNILGTYYLVTAMVLQKEKKIKTHRDSGITKSDDRDRDLMRKLP
jgi:hypothetical protein